MSIKVFIPNSYLPERTYVCRYVFERRLGLSIEIVASGGPECAGRTVLTDGTHSLAIPDGLFGLPESDWLGPACRPSVCRLRLHHLGESNGQVAAEVVAFFGVAEGGGPAATRISETKMSFNFDALGGIFFLLTNLEEVIDHERDEHGRYPGALSVVAQEALERRPVVDETVALVGTALEHLWPGIVKSTDVYQVRPSHDIDHPFLYHGLAPMEVAQRVGRRLAGDFVLRKSLFAAGETLHQFSSYLARGASADPYFTIDGLMDESEARGLRSCFYFIIDSNSAMDGRRYAEDPLIHESFRRIADRGHMIGLHASYACYDDPARAISEATKLRGILDKLGIEQAELGVRQHYLRWAGPQHWTFWNDAGMDYDASQAFSDRIGFRCGTSHYFPVFDLRARRQLRIEERPLLVMDVTFCPSTARAWKADRQRIMSQMDEVLNACRRYSGTLEVLWHNSQLQNAFLREIYHDVLQAATQGSG